MATKTKKLNKKVKPAGPKPQVVQRRLLDDRQCRVFLHAMHEFGYPSLTFDRVRAIADEVAAGTHSETDVIAVIMAKQIDESVAMKRGR